VGFTGSRQGGMALMDIAANRAQPIPVYAEMSAINPVVLMPAALSACAEALASGFAGSLMLGAGQFCTNPGLVIAIAGDGLERFKSVAAAALAESTPQAMLTPGIHSAYAAGVDAWAAHAEVTRIGGAAPSALLNRCTAALFETSAAAFIADSALGHEVFGAAAMIVHCRDMAELRQVVEALEGQLTASLHIADEDQSAAAELLPLLAQKAGRVLANGWPTGVEVTAAMVHGGPFPATSDGRSTSVGTLAMARFLRPVCYQDIPDVLLPPPLRPANPWHLPRTVNGQREHAA
jgi:NADP-dependent aldehyde dehydrogenase